MRSIGDNTFWLLAIRRSIRSPIIARAASQDGARIVFDCRMVDDPSMMPSTNSARAFAIASRRLTTGTQPNDYNISD